MYWSEEKIAVLRERYSTDGPTKLAALFSVSRMAVTCKARKLGIEPCYRKRDPYEWTPQRLTDLRRLYPTADSLELCRTIQLPLHAIRSKAKALGLRCLIRAQLSGATRAVMQKSCNIHFFDEWCPTMAYVLGFLFADGSINKRGSDVIVGLAVRDECVLDFLKEVTRSTRPFYYRQSSKDGYNRQQSVFFTLGSTIIVRRLEELGLHQRKSHRNDPFPDVPDAMMPHFLRGYFDGDGSAYVTGQGYCKVSLIGTPRFIVGARNALVRLAGMQWRKARYSRGKTAAWKRVIWGARADLQKFYDYIYPPDYGFCLERKWLVLHDWLASARPGAASDTETETEGLLEGEQ